MKENPSWKINSLPAIIYTQLMTLLRRAHETLLLIVCFHRQSVTQRIRNTWTSYCRVWCIEMRYRHLKIDYHFFKVNSKEAMKTINHPLQPIISFRCSKVKDGFIIIQIQHWRWFFNFLIFSLLPQIPYELEWTHRHNEVNLNRNAVGTSSLLWYYTYFNDFMILFSLHILFGRLHKYNKC